MKKCLALLFLLFTVGCTSSSTESIKTVTSQYELLTFDDGIDIEEAKIIGQRELIRQNLVKFYDLENPRIVWDVNDLPNHSKYWFVSFKEKRVANIEFIFMAIIQPRNQRCS